MNENTNKNIIRISIRSLYAMQKLRIQQGNRIFQCFRHRLGITSSESEEELSPEAAEVLSIMRMEYKRVTDGIKRFTKGKPIDSKLFDSYAELYLMQSYERQLEAEACHENVVKDELSRHRIYKDFLSGVKGVGTLMAGVMLSEIDITKCHTMSALYKYCGLDVVLRVDEETGEIVGEGRSRKKHHLEKKTYINRDGEEVETVGITFNPFLKTKMVGVLGSSFMKQKDSKYRTIYDNYKFRLQNSPEHKDKTKGHIHAMATRYMVKLFLADLWTQWRTYEGLPVRPSYAEEKLGIVHSGVDRRAA